MRLKVNDQFVVDYINRVYIHLRRDRTLAYQAMNGYFKHIKITS